MTNYDYWVQVEEIRDLCGTKKQKDIAKIYGVDPTTISDINKNKTWKINVEEAK